MRSQVILILLGIVAVAVGLAACESVDNGPSEADVQASYYEVPTAEEAAALLGAQFEKGRRPVDRAGARFRR
ncbi:MAG: hypothetical protein M5R36_10795 [Deltaproteobacteria bacterium]|nr:hypothetical protein [Deltaproteobacteria bacterium]